MKSKSREYKKKTVLELGHYFTKWTRSLVREPETVITEPSKTMQGEEIKLKDFIRLHASGEIPEMAMSAYDFDPTQEDNHDLDVSPRYATDIAERADTIKSAIQNQLDLEQEIIENAAREAKQKSKSKSSSSTKKASEKSSPNAPTTEEGTTDQEGAKLD